MNNSFTHFNRVNLFQKIKLNLAMCVICVCAMCVCLLCDPANSLDLKRICWSEFAGANSLDRSEFAGSEANSLDLSEFAHI